ncbi:hypothetical protein PDESU_06201 [Pontiella desulfatans]|uniref:DUF2397 domain-containing protein n=1 Tax=Pontiella desulfatans TaxID=2750659 RepID=A0A6C2UBQ6_PONDE|nr:DUF2397 family protein [Pontiella desulfatans]VGO17602.1 hypothetical protein PDESU_06201 [Pontiella desulfatans]
MSAEEESEARRLLQESNPRQLPADAGTLLLRHQNPNLGHLIGAERSAFYLNILYGLLLFRRSHELEPLHEDIFQFVLPAQQVEADDGYDANAFNQDMRQLEKWELVTQRIERERLRGYKDTRRRKFRYRISNPALSFLQWLEDQLRAAIEPEGADTRNLLEEAAGGVRELQRTLNKIQKTKPDPDKARTATYQLSRIGHLALDINHSLADFNTRLVAFTLERYDIATAQAILNELQHFLENYINRIQILRREIVPELENLASPRFKPKWELCKTLMEDEIKHSSMLMRGRTIPDARQEIDRLIRFYELGGQLDQLCARIRASAQSVWRKLYTHLRELERKSHRMEDLRDRIAEMAACSGEHGFAGFINQLIAPARMVADMHYWDAAEKADPPQPRQEQHTVRQAPIGYLKPKPKGDASSIRSLNDEKIHRLRRWIEATHAELPAALSQGGYTGFSDQASLIELARNGLLGNGRNLAKVDLKLETTATPAGVEIDERLLEFKELMVSKANKEQDNGH